MIVPLLTNRYGKISTVIVFDAPKISQGRSTGAEPVAPICNIKSSPLEPTTKVCSNLSINICTRLAVQGIRETISLRYSIQYKKESTNLTADALSQQMNPDQLLAISSATLTWMVNLQVGYQDDLQCKQLLAELSTNPQNNKGFSLTSGILRYKTISG
jgi:hypothetical protein